MIDREQVLHVAKLARLRLSEEEVERMAGELSKILKHVETMNELEQRVEDLLVPLDVAVIGCVVNGPGEAKEAHIGLTGGTPNLVYIDGKPAQKLTNDNLVDELEQLIRRKAAEKQAADAAVIARS